MESLDLWPDGGSSAATGFRLAQQGRTTSFARALKPVCLPMCVRVPETCTGWLQALKGEGLPLRMCACASQRLDLYGKLGDGACKAHDDTSTRRAHDSKTRKEWRFSWVRRAKGKTFRLPTRACNHEARSRPGTTVTVGAKLQEFRMAELVCALASACRLACGF
jgi:hypothetical protein